MNDAGDCEALLWGEPDSSADSSVESAQLRAQRDVHRLLLATVSAQRKPQVSPGFDAALARRLRSHPGGKPLVGGAKTFMTVYWSLLLVATGAALWQLDLPVPAPGGPLGVALLVVLVPLSLHPALSASRLPDTLARITRFMSSQLPDFIS